MKYNININQKFGIENNLSFSECSILDIIGELSTWADEKIIDGVVYYRLHSEKIIEIIPIISDKKNTILGIIKNLLNKEMIERIVKNNIPYYRLTTKGKEYKIEGYGKISILGVEKNQHYNNIIDNNINNISIGEKIQEQNYKRLAEVERSKEITSIIELFKEYCKTNNILFSPNLKFDRIYISNLIKNNSFLEIKNNNNLSSNYELIDIILKYANKLEFWNNKISSIGFFYNNWIKIINNLKQNKVIDLLSKKRSEEEIKKELNNFTF